MDVMKEEGKSPNPEILYEDENFIAINKPAGLLVHKVSSIKHQASSERTLVDWLLERHPEIRNVGDSVKLPDGSYGARDPLRPGLVHRLDRDTSGVLLVPKTQEYFEYLKRLFQEHRMEKKYAALVRGIPKNSAGRIEAPIGLIHGSTKRSVRSAKMRKEALTEYRVKRVFEGRDGDSYALLDVCPRTGRTHQIRVHLASIGHPVVGDPLYGGKKRPAWAARLMLHATSIEFSSASGRRIRVESPLPEEFLRLDG